MKRARCAEARHFFFPFFLFQRKDDRSALFFYVSFREVGREFRFLSLGWKGREKEKGWWNFRTVLGDKRGGETVQRFPLILHRFSRAEVQGRLSSSGRIRKMKVVSKVGFQSLVLQFLRFILRRLKSFELRVYIGKAEDATGRRNTRKR